MNSENTSNRQLASGQASIRSPATGAETYSIVSGTTGSKTKAPENKFSKRIAHQEKKMVKPLNADLASQNTYPATTSEDPNVKIVENNQFGLSLIS